MKPNSLESKCDALLGEIEWLKQKKQEYRELIERDKAEHERLKSAIYKARNELDEITRRLYEAEQSYAPFEHLA